MVPYVVHRLLTNHDAIQVGDMYSYDPLVWRAVPPHWHGLDVLDIAADGYSAMPHVRRCETVYTTDQQRAAIFWSWLGGGTLGFIVATVLYLLATKLVGG